MLDVLIVEDDVASRDALERWLRKRGYEPRTAENLAVGRRELAERPPDLALLDLELPDGSGLQLLAELNASHTTDVVMISGRTTVDAAIEALRRGARDFLTKPVDLTRLEAILKALAQTAELRREVTSLRSELRRLGRFGEMVGASEPMQKAYDCIERVAPVDETVFLTGPTGVGKEVTARTLHRLSRRASKPFVAINCGAVSPNLVESEFFGHERGAFTGADRRHKGVFEQADGGTLFLDEITEMPIEMQVKLLRVLETRKVTRVGGSAEIEIDVRVIAASNRDPKGAVDEGRLREDLMYRLFVFPIDLPALADRDGDVPLLTRHFIDELNEEYEASKGITDDALAALEAQTWPGNVRELRNVVRRAYIMSKTDIDCGSLPFDTEAARAAARARTATETSRKTSPDGLTIEPGMSIADVEQRLIEATLEHFDGNKKRSAKSLGISLKTLYARLKVYEAARGAAG